MKNKKETSIQKSKSFPTRPQYPRKVNDFLNEILDFAYGSEKTAKKIEKMLPAFRKTNNPSEKFIKVTEKAMMINGLNNQWPLIESVGQGYKAFVANFALDLIKEYQCKTSSEKALAQIIASAHTRILEYSRQLTACQKDSSYSNKRAGFYSMISKEIDRANRQFIAALTTLKQLKAPSFEINVKTKAAFVAQNQQLNIKNNSSNNNENIKPK